MDRCSVDPPERAAHIQPAPLLQDLHAAPADIRFKALYRDVIQGRYTGTLYRDVIQGRYTGTFARRAARLDPMRALRYE
jgi:hypothetical protein